MTVDSVKLDNLTDLLSKDPIIATFTSEQLARQPERAEHNYSVHAKTHIPLGDTASYVETIAKWVTGQNKGAFVGAVTGDYGEGKTSFLVHTWEQAAARGIMAVPPFSWRSVADLVAGVNAWAIYKLQELNPDETKAAKKLWEEYRQKTLEETARGVAKKTGQDIDTVLQVLSQTSTNLEVSAEQFLDYCAELSEIISNAGYNGLLVLLDEPEVAAKGTSTSQVAQVLFDIANGLLSREGNYGVFVSIPQNFLAQIQASFSSLPARLQGRGCFPHLGNLYNADFAATLWNRYAQQLGFDDYEHNIVSPVALEAIGQVTSSERKDLAYGPRSVISAFRRAVELFQQNNTAYTPEQFVEDCLDQEVTVKQQTYGAYVSQILSAPEADEIGADTLKVLCAFPNGVQQNRLEMLGLNAEHLVQTARPGHPLLYRRGGYIGLQLLTKQGGQEQQDLLQQSMQDIVGSYAPRPEVLAKAAKAFVKEMLPVIFKKQAGQALLGWSYEDEKSLGERATLVKLVGASEQTKAYPLRPVHIVVSDPEANTEKILQQYQRGDEPDILVHLRLHWRPDQALAEWRVDVSEGDPSENESGVINLVLDLITSVIQQEQLELTLGAPELLTPLGILYLIHEMDRLSLPNQDEQVWKAIKENLRPKLLSALFGDEALRHQVAQDLSINLPGSPSDLIPTISRHIFQERYPEYQTLIVQPQWMSKVQTYANVIKNQGIPLAARRGQKPWIAPKDEVSRAFNTSVMNLTAWAAGLESLLTIASDGGNLRVDFKLHPFEKQIQDVIMSGEAEERIKIDDKEAWWIPFEEIYPLIRSAGYAEEEWQAVVEIGKSRGTFDVERHRNKPIFYCLPFDSEQMQQKLREKLEGLRRHIEAFSKIPDYKGSLNFEEVEEKIEGVTEETHFDSLQNELNRVFEQDNARLPHYFNQLSADLQKLSQSSRQELNALKGRPYTGLEQPVTSQSSWGSNFNRYIMNNLLKDTNALRSEFDEILVSVDRAVSNFAQNKSGNPLEKAQRIADGWQEYNMLKGKLETQILKNQNLSRQVREHEAWRDLLSHSDRLYQHLLKDQNDLSHRIKADEFLRQLELVWNEISEYLQDRALSGLGSYKQFEERLKEIEESRTSYQKSLAAEFGSAKNQVNEILEAANVDRCAEAFNPADVQGCYDRLYAQAATNIKNALDKGRQEIDDETRELLYSRNVLKRVPFNQADTLLEELASSRTSLTETFAQVTVEWIKVALEQEDQNVGASLQTVLVQASRDAQKARQAIKLSAQEQNEIGSVEREMLALLDSPQDLKGLVLALMEREHDSEQVLDTSLTALSELFKRGRINIRVEKSRR